MVIKSQSKSKSKGDLSHVARDGHVVVREGLLIEFKLKKADATGKRGSKSSVSTSDDVTCEMAHDNGVYIQERCNVSLFANGNLVIYPAKNIGVFSTWKQKTKDTKVRIINLHQALIRDSHSYPNVPVFAFQILPFHKTEAAIVLGLASEARIREWMRDIVRTAAVSADNNITKDSKVTRRSEVARCIDAWQHSHYVMRLKPDRLPTRYWNIESHPRFNNGDPLVAFTTWFDFISMVKEYILSKGLTTDELVESEDANRGFSINAGSSIEERQSTQITRLLDAMYLLGDSRRVSTNINDLRIGSLLQLSVHMSLKFGICALLTPQKVPLEALVEPSSALRAVSTFSRKFIAPSYDQVPAIVLRYNGEITLLKNFPSSSDAAYAYICTIVNADRLLMERDFEVRFYWARTSSQPFNERASAIVKQSILGDVVMLVDDDAMFKRLVSESCYLRPEYVPSRLSYFRAHYYLMGRLKKEQHDHSELYTTLKLVESQIAKDVVVARTYAAVAHLNRNIDLFVHPMQIVELLHTYGVEYNHQVLNVLFELAHEDIRDLMLIDYFVMQTKGNLKAIELISQHREVYDFNTRAIYALLRLNGQVPNLNFVLRPVAIASLYDLVHVIDSDFIGVSPSYFDVGGVFMHLRRLSRGATQVDLNDTDMADDDDVVATLAKDAKQIAVAIVNESEEHLPVVSPGNTKLAKSAILEYASLCQTIFVNDGSERLRRRYSTAVSDDSAGSSPAQSTNVGENAPQENHAWWLRNKLSISYNIRAWLTWIIVALKKLSDECAFENVSESLFKPALRAVQNAYDMIPPGYNLQLLMHFIFRGCLSPNIHELLFAMYLCKLQRTTDLAKVSVAMANFAMDFPGRPQNLSDVKALRRITQLLQASTSESISIPLRRRCDNTRVNLIRESLFLKRPMYALLFDGGTQRASTEASLAMEHYMNMRASEQESTWTISHLLKLLSTHLGSIEVDFDLGMGEDNAAGDDGMKANVNSSTMLLTPSITAKEDHDFTRIKSTESVSCVIVRGKLIGLGNDEEEQLIENPQNVPEKIAIALNYWGVLSPDVFPNSLEITSVACGHRHTAMVTAGGLCLTFGYGGAGRLGHCNEDSLLAPQVVETLLTLKFRVKKASCGRDHTIVIGTDVDGHRGVAYSWGWGEAGRLGLGVDAGAQSIPERVELVCKRLGGRNISSLVYSFVDVACGFDHSLFLSSCGKVFSCGAGLFGRLGHGSFESNMLVPTLIQSNLMDEFVTQIVAGDLHSMALTKSGAVYSWGYGESGALGHGDKRNRLEPKLVVLLDDVKKITKIACGSFFSVALDVDGRVWSWGEYRRGQLGIAGSEEYLQANHCSPQLVRVAASIGLPSRVENIFCGGNRTVAIDSDMNLIQWGNPEYITDGPQCPRLVHLDHAHLDIRDDFRSWICGIGSYHAIYIGLNTKANQKISEELCIVPEDIYESPATGATDAVLFSGTLFESVAEDCLFQLDRSFAEELKIMKRPVNERGEVHSTVKLECGTFRCVTSMLGVKVKDAAGDVRGWHFVENAHGSLYRWPVNEFLDTNSHKFLEYLQVSVKSVSSDPSGVWTAITAKTTNAALKRDTENRATNVFIWRNKSVTPVDSFDPCRLWPLHEDSIVSDVSISNTRVVITDGDGLLYEITPKQKFRDLNESVESPELTRVKCRIVWMYRKYQSDQIRKNPAFINTMLELYENRESSLLELLQQKYGPEPEDFEKYAPSGLQKEFPQHIPIRGRVVCTGCGSLFAMALTASGDLYSWGTGAYGELGLGLYVSKSAQPVKVKFPIKNNKLLVKTPEESSKLKESDSTLKSIRELDGKVQMIACGQQHAMAMTRDGKVYSWGSAVFGETGLGQYTCQFDPTYVTIEEKDYVATHISASGHHSVIVTSVGEAWVFGSGKYGQLGMEKEFTNVPMKVPCDRFVSKAFAAPTSTVFFTTGKQVLDDMDIVYVQ